MEQLDYIKWFAVFAWTPIIIVWAFYWRYLIKFSKVFLYCIIGSVIFGTVWDYWATHYWLWHFSPDHTLGVNILGLPVEEYVFFISFTILYASIALVLKDKMRIKKL